MAKTKAEKQAELEQACKEAAVQIVVSNAPEKALIDKITKDLKAEREEVEALIIEATKALRADNEGVQKAKDEAAKRQKEAEEKQRAAAIEMAGEAGMVMVTVPKAFKLRIKGVTHQIAAGVFPLKKELAEHSYAKANGLTIHSVGKK